MVRPDCFSIEHDPADQRCRDCPVFEPCGKSTKRNGLIRLSNAKYQLVPPALDNRVSRSWTDSTGEIAQKTWPKIYWRLMGIPASGGLTPDIASKVESNAAACGLSIDDYIVVLLTVHIKSKPDEPYWPTMMTGPRAVDTVLEWVRAAKENTGEATAKAVRQLVHLETTDALTKSIQASEVQMGHQVIQYRLHKSGPDRDMLRELYAEREMSWHPTWLAMDEHYMDLVIRSDSATLSRSEFPISTELNKHRRRVASERVQMIRSKTKARTTWEIRESIAPTAVQTVLRQFGFLPGQFEMKDQPITDMLWLWTRLALAIQQFQCLEKVHSTPV